MQTSIQRNEAGAGRYETFVLRVWVREAGTHHGEIRHVQTNSSIRFHEMQQAIEFLQTTVERVAHHLGVPPSHGSLSD